MEDDMLTIAGIAASDPNFTILVQALETAELVEALDMAGDELTVFAPTNAAFAQLAEDLGFTGDTADTDAVFGFIAGALAGLDPNGDPVPLLTDILLYHVSPGVQTADEIAETGNITTLLANTGILAATGRLIDFEPDLLDPEIVTADIGASNGLVQVVDRVLLPLDVPGNDAPSITDIATTTEGFSILTIALQTSGLDAVLADPNGEFTVFAPTDDAFIALAQDFGFAGDTTDSQAVFDAIAGVLAGLSTDGDPIPVLVDILLYHVSAGASTTAELADLPQVETLLLDSPVIVSDTVEILDFDPDRENAEFVPGLTGVEASNGVVQAIDRVLLPFDLDDPAASGTIADVVAQTSDGFDSNSSDFDILFAALEAAELTGALADPEAELTVFAPDDGAFLSLAEALGQDASSEEAAFNGIVDAITGLTAGTDPIPLLTSILTYHVVDGEFSRAALAAGPELTTLFGIAPTTDGAGLSDVDRGFEDPEFDDLFTDVVTGNGIIQVIDEVLLLINIPDASDELGGVGDDEFTVGPETLVVDGGDGADSATFSGAVADTTFGFIDGGFTATTDGTLVELFNTESFVFDDETVIVSDSELAAQVFRAFGIGLGREGDIAGVTFWTGEAEANGIGFVADAILVSDEFAEQFGGEIPSDEEIVAEFYGNFLGREGDEAGLAFWNEQIASGSLDASDLILAFSESPEFLALTENTFDDGVLLFA